MQAIHVIEGFHKFHLHTTSFLVNVLLMMPQFSLVIDAIVEVRASDMVTQGWLEFSRVF